jgi:K+-transporting ATPase ATPase C chain
MLRQLKVCLLLLAMTLFLCSVLYPLILWGIGQTVFPNQAEGSLVDEEGILTTHVEKARGSRLIAQPFKGDEYFQSRPSATSPAYNAAASGASNWAASNILLRDRVARQLGPIVRYAYDERNPSTKRGKPVAPDIEQWFRRQETRFQKRNASFVVQWAKDHPGLAEQWIKDNVAAVAGWFQKPADTIKANIADAATKFFPEFARKHPGAWPTAEEKTEGGHTVKFIKPVRAGADLQAYFFDLWLQAHRDAILENVPADMVMSSGSGLDPHITVQNARYQLKTRVAEKQAQKVLEEDSAVAKLIEQARNQKDETRRKQLEAQVGQIKARLEKKVRAIIGQLIDDQTEAPLGGLLGVEIVNVLELNVAMDKRMKQLARE